MNTKLLMTASAIAMGIVGILLSFMPHEILNYLNQAATAGMDAVVLQVLGALYFAFAMVNWTAKANLIGGIYARPIAIGNLTHFTVAAFALIKHYTVSPTTLLLVITIAYVVGALLFAFVFFSHPVRDNTADS